MFLSHTRDWLTFIHLQCMILLNGFYMTRLTRPALIALAAFAFLLLLCSLAALVFALWPLGVDGVQATIAPTLLAPP